MKSMSTGSNFGPKLCGDALAIKGDLCVTGSLLPENAIELWSIKVRLGINKERLLFVFFEINN